MKSIIYIAPQGFVYDYLNPKIDADGKEIHLYANKISISHFDTIDKYRLVQEAEGKKE